jgi:hypothetical protein
MRRLRCLERLDSSDDERSSSPLVDSPATRAAICRAKRLAKVDPTVGPRSRVYGPHRRSGRRPQYPVPSVDVRTGQPNWMADARHLCANCKRYTWTPGGKRRLKTRPALPSTAPVMPTLPAPPPQLTLTSLPCAAPPPADANVYGLPATLFELTKYSVTTVTTIRDAGGSVVAQQTSSAHF